MNRSQTISDFAVGKAITVLFFLALSMNALAIIPWQSASPDSSQSSSYLRLDSIILTGNNVTKDKIILRELLFKQGEEFRKETLDTLMKNSRDNLINTSLFNFVTIGSKELKAGHVNVLINMIERWYIWPIPVLKIADRNFNVWWQTKDLGRLSYGFYIDWRNFRGRRENLITHFQFGYNEQIDLQYIVPFINRKQTLGLTFGAGYTRNHEVAVRTYENKLEFYRNDHIYLRKDWYASLLLQVRRGIYNSHLIELRYDQQEFSDSVMVRNQDYSPDQANTVRYFTFHYKFKADHRDYKDYPLEGHYFDVELFKHCLPVAGADDIDFLYVLSTFRKYWKLSDRFYYAAGLNAKFSDGGYQPYFMIRGIGYDRDIVRSYEYYVVDGQNFGILKTNLKFALLPTRTGQIKFIRSEKFSKIFIALYLNLFVDAGYVDNRYHDDLKNDLENRFLLGYGLGIDFVTYYDIIMRLEFSTDKMGESGLFLHFRAPI